MSIKMQSRVLKIKGKIINLLQGSDDWYKLRQNHYGASETNAVLGRSSWKPRSFKELADIKLGLDKVFYNRAMQDGNHYEARARELVSRLFNDTFAPLTYINDNADLPLISSLDGINFNENILVEIKTSSKDLSELVDYYYYQIQQQLMLSGAKYGFLVRYDKEQDCIQISSPLIRDDTAINLLIDKWSEFHTFFISYKEEVANGSRKPRVTKTEGFINDV